MDLSIIIVNYNTKELLRQTVNSIQSNPAKHSQETIIVDNSSSDGSVEMVWSEMPQVRLIANTVNEGFAKANNKGIRYASGRYVLLLNSDTVVLPGTLDTMIEFMDNHTLVGAVGCKVVLPDGSLDKACRRSFPTPMNSLYHALGLSHLFPNHPKFSQYNLTHLDEDETYPVDCLVGAFMMVRREVIEQIGGLDEQFFMYGEDIDWCYRIKEAGWQIYYYPEAKIIHYKGASSKKQKYKMIYEFHRAMILFYNKYYIRKYNPLVTLAVYVGIWCKFLLVVLLNIFKRGGGRAIDKNLSENT